VIFSLCGVRVIGQLIGEESYCRLCLWGHGLVEENHGGVKEIPFEESENLVVGNGSLFEEGESVSLFYEGGNASLVCEEESENPDEESANLVSHDGAISNGVGI